MNDQHFSLISTTMLALFLFKTENVHAVVQHIDEQSARSLLQTSLPSAALPLPKGECIGITNDSSIEELSGWLKEDAPQILSAIYAVQELIWTTKTFLYSVENNGFDLIHRPENIPL